MAKQTFRFQSPGALSVLLVGDFTHWQERPIAMKKGHAGVWTTTVDLDPGSYHYRFMVDGEWRDDPENTVRVPNVFGTEDAICKVA